MNISQKKKETVLRYGKIFGYFTHKAHPACKKTLPRGKVSAILHFSRKAYIINKELTLA